MPVSLSGPFEMQGRQTLAGIQAWVDDVNAAGGLRVGGVPPVPVELLHYDDAGQRDRVKAATERLITDDRVDLLVGPYSAVMTLAAAEVAESHGKLMWNQGGASPNVYRRGYKWVVGILSPATSYLSELPNALRQACPEAASLLIARASRGAFPQDVCTGVEERASALGFRIVGSLRFEPESEDFSEIVAAVSNNGAGCFCWRGALSRRPALGAAVGRIGNGPDRGGGSGRRSSPVRGGTGLLGRGIHRSEPVGVRGGIRSRLRPVGGPGSGFPAPRRAPGRGLPDGPSLCCRSGNAAVPAGGGITGRRRTQAGGVIARLYYVLRQVQDRPGDGTANGPLYAAGAMAGWAQGCSMAPWVSQRRPSVPLAAVGLHPRRSWRNCLNCDFFDSEITMIFRILVIRQSDESQFRRKIERPCSRRTRR